MNAGNTGSTYDIDIVNTADSNFATTMIPKKVYLKMLVYTTDGKWRNNNNYIIKLLFKCATGSATVVVPTVL